ncbi:MAG: hypothetical protein JWL77_5763 [Chthonomonadaceae bacterium]|nr:hypothetical protein [Chthonomonadaceae bacterium]
MQTTPRTPHKRLSKRPLVRILCLVAIVGLGVWCTTHFFSPLPREAYPVLSTAPWFGRNSPAAYPQQWLPNGDLAYLKTSANGLPQVCYQKMDASGPVGTVRYGPELPIGSEFDTFSPAPDEQWVAYIQSTRQYRLQTFLLSADGKTTCKGGEYFSGWLADSRHYLCIDHSGAMGTKVYHVDSLNKETLSPDVYWNPYVPLTIPTDSPTFVIRGYFIDDPEIRYNAPLMEMRSFPLAHPAVGAQKWQANVPPGMNSGTASPSPDRRHLLWNVERLRTSPWNAWLGRVNAKWKIRPTHEKHYFLSDLHGNNMRPVLTNALGGSLTLNPTWTPDSKHLSFIYKDQLYLLPIE